MQEEARSAGEGREEAKCTYHSLTYLNNTERILSPSSKFRILSLIQLPLLEVLHIAITYAHITETQFFLPVSCMCFLSSLFSKR